MSATTVKRILAALAILIFGLSLGGCFYYPDGGYYGPPIYHGEGDGD